jgi:hypothetical protein
MGFRPDAQNIEGYLPDGAYELHVRVFGEPMTSGLGKVEVAGKPAKGQVITLLTAGQIPVVVRKDFTATDTAAAQIAPQSIIMRAQAMQRSLEVTLQPVGSRGSVGGLKNAPNQGDDGMVLENVEEGVYHVLVSPHRGYVSSMSSRGVDLLRQPLAVGPGGVSDPIEITLREDTASVSGYVTVADSGGTKLDADAAYRVTCIPLSEGFVSQSPGMSFYTGTDANHKFGVSNLAPGEYLVLAFTGSRTDPMEGMTDIEYRNPEVLNKYRTMGTVVTLTAGQSAEIRVPAISISEFEAEK